MDDTPRPTTSEYPLAPLCKRWWKLLKTARDSKKDAFGDDADEMMAFFICGKELHESMWDRNRTSKQFSGDDEESMPAPKFRVCVGKVAEGVELFGPTLYHRNPEVTVEPKTPDIPNELLIPLIPQETIHQAQMAAQQAGQQFDVNSLIPPDPSENGNKIAARLMQYFINYIQRENDKKTHARRAIDEAIIKGFGCLAGGTELYTMSPDGIVGVRRIRDVYRSWEGYKLWDGSKWVGIVAMTKKPRVGTEIKLGLRSGESINCTLEHKWPTNRGVLRADQLKVGDVLDSCRLPEPVGLTSPQFLPDSDIGWLVGLYLAEGHIPSDKNDVCFALSLHEEEVGFVDRVRKIVESYGGRVTVRGREGSRGIQVHAQSRIVVSILREFILSDGAFEKHLSASCWNKSDEFLRGLIGGYLDGDGHWVEREDIWRLSFCENDELAKDIRILCARLGYLLTLRKVRENKDGAERRYYKGSVRLGGARLPNALKPKTEIISISQADWRCDSYYDLNVDCEPRLFALATGTLSHNCLWTEVFQQFPGGPDMVGTFYDTVDNLLLDPDAETIDECWWIARRRTQPYWYVAQKFKIDEQYLREKYTTHESRMSEALTDDPKRPYHHKKSEGDTNDLIEYWEIYSKMGFGAERLKGSPHGEDQDADSKAVEETLSSFGDNVYFAVAEKVPFFLNFKTDHLHELMTEPDQEILDQMHEEKLNDVQWPIPFWADGQWPMTPVIFHEVPNSVWPMGHFKPGLGYLKFLNWVISFLINKIRVSSRTVAAIAAGADEDIKDRLFSGKDFELLEFKSAAMAAGTDINKLVSFLQMPEIQPDVWKIVESVFQLFDKATGLTEIMYGAQGGMRSATEAREKAAHASVRTDDMAAKVEEALTLAARKEAMAARWLLDRQSLQPILGDRCTSLWEQFVSSKNIQAVAREFNYTIEAGSTRKPDKDRMAQNATQMIQYVPPLLQAAANPQFNGVVNKILEEAAEANDWGWKSPIIPAPVPQPNPMQQKVEAEIQGKQQELQMKMQGQQAELQMQAQKHQIELQAIQAKAQADAQKAGMQIQTDQIKAQSQMQLEREKAQQEVTLSKMDMLNQIAQRQQEAHLGAQEHQMQMRHQQDVHRQGMVHAEQQAQVARQKAKEKPSSGDKK